jgi:hypothetical protein
MVASANPILADREARDPTLFCTAYKRQRFYMFTRTEPEYVASSYRRFLLPDLLHMLGTTRHKGIVMFLMSVPHARNKPSHPLSQ